MLQRIWDEQNRTIEALASARDFAAVSSHELRTPLTAMRTNLEVLATLDLPDEQRKEVLSDVIRTQTRIEATLSALERLAQGELSTSEDHVPVDITELLDRAAHDAMRIYPDLDVSLVAVADLHHRRAARRPTSRRGQRDRQCRQTRRRHQRSAVRGQLAGRRGDRHRRQRQRAARSRTPQWCSSGSPAARPRRTRAPDSVWRWWPSRRTCTAARRRWKKARSAAHVCCCGCPARADTHAGGVNSTFCLCPCATA